MWTRVNNLHPVELKHKSGQIVSFTTEELISILKNRAAKKLDRFVRVDFHPFVYSIMLMGEEGQQLKGRFLMPTETIGTFQLGDFITFNKTQIIDEITFDVQGDHFIYKKKDASPVRKSAQLSSQPPLVEENTVGISEPGDSANNSQPVDKNTPERVISKPQEQKRDASPVRRSSQSPNREVSQLSSPQQLHVEEVTPAEQEILFGLAGGKRIWFFLKLGTKIYTLKKNKFGVWNVASTGRPPNLDNNSPRYRIPWTRGTHGFEIDGCYEDRKFVSTLLLNKCIEVWPVDI